MQLPYWSTSRSGSKVDRRARRITWPYSEHSCSLCATTFRNMFCQQLLTSDATARSCGHRSTVWRRGRILRILPSPYRWPIHFSPDLYPGASHLRLRRGVERIPSFAFGSSPPAGRAHLSDAVPRLVWLGGLSPLLGRNFELRGIRHDVGPAAGVGQCRGHYGVSGFQGELDFQLVSTGNGDANSLTLAPPHSVRLLAHNGF